MNPTIETLVAHLNLSVAQALAGGAAPLEVIAALEQMVGQIEGKLEEKREKRARPKPFTRKDGT